MEERVSVNSATTGEPDEIAAPTGAPDADESMISLRDVHKVYRLRDGSQVHALDGPVYLRVGKLPVPVVTDEDTPFEIGKAVQLREGDDVTLLTTGSMASETLGAADLLAAEGIKAEVLHLHTIKPLDAEAGSAVQHGIFGMHVQMREALLSHVFSSLAVVVGLLVC